MPPASSDQNVLPIRYSQIVSSKPFRFLVGPTKIEYTIHSALAASLSPVLNSLINGHMKEAREGVVEWPEVDELTFALFSQFAYAGNYDSPEIAPPKPAEGTIIDLESGAPSPTESGTAADAAPAAPASIQANAGSTAAAAAAADDDWGFWADRSKKKKKKKPFSKRSAVLDELTQNNDDDSLPSVDWWLGRTERTHFKPELYHPPPAAAKEDSEKLEKPCDTPLLCHARVYVFADTYDIVALRGLARNKLASELVRLESDREWTGDALSVASTKALRQLPELLRYVLENTREDDRLRSTMTKFTACVVEEFWERDDFQTLLDDYDDFSRTLMKEMLARLD